MKEIQVQNIKIATKEIDTAKDLQVNIITKDGANTVAINTVVKQYAKHLRRNETNMAKGEQKVE